MTGASILTTAYTLTNTNSATFLDANSSNIYAHLNRLYGHRIVDILRVRVDANATIQKSYQTHVNATSLVEGENGYNGEYAFPTDLLRPVRVEVSYDGQTWNKATFYDNALNTNSELNASSETPSQSNPHVDFNRGSYFVRPVNKTQDVAKGLYIEYKKRQADFDASSEPEEIEKNLQDLLAYDLAGLEIIMNTDKYSSAKITIFNNAKREVEDRFFAFYRTGLPSKKVMTFMY